MAKLDCKDCDFETEEIDLAVQHVEENQLHTVTAKGLEGTDFTEITIAIEQDDGYQDYWDTECATCDGGGCGDCA